MFLVSSCSNETEDVVGAAPVWDNILTPMVKWPPGQNTIVVDWSPVWYTDTPPQKKKKKKKKKNGIQ